MARGDASPAPSLLVLLAAGTRAAEAVYASEYLPRRSAPCSHPPCADGGRGRGVVHTASLGSTTLPEHFSWAHVDGTNYLTKVLNQHLPQVRCSPP